MPAGSSGSTTRNAARPGAAGVVSRPGLSERLSKSARVTVVSAPAGSGKSVLLRSWINEGGQAERTALVATGRDERDPQRWWLAVLDALRQTPAGAALIRPLTTGPDLDGWAIVERLLSDLAPLDERLWLVIDDVHELDSDQARRQLELLMMRAPAELRFVLATRHDVRLGLHRLRLEGELTEIRPDDLRFTAAEAQSLFAAAQVELAGSALRMLYERTEGWVAGLRMAALSLTGHPDPGRFAAEFSGSERTVAEYLLAEVLERQPESVRRLLLRTSVLERVNGELADLLTGASGSEGLLHDLEDANAFVVSLDTARSWFRYHQLFADLLQLQLRRTQQEEVIALHKLAADWLAGHGHPVEAIRQAQAARDWALARRLLADSWPRLYLSGQAATVHALLTGFPTEMTMSDAVLAALTAADEELRGSLEVAERYLDLAERGLALGPETLRGQVEAPLAAGRLQLAWLQGDLWAVPEQAQRLLALAAPPGLAESHLAPPARAGLADELHVLTLIGLGDAEAWTGQLEKAESHLEHGLALARQTGRPYLEFRGLIYRAELELSRWFPQAAELSRQALDLAERHGWTDDFAAGHAYMVLGSALAWQGRLDEAPTWLQRAELIMRSETHPTVVMGIQYARGQLELGRGQAADALTAFRAAERLAGPHPLARPMRAWLVHALVLQGDLEQAGQVLAGLSERAQERAEMRIAAAVLCLARDDLNAAAASLAPVLDGSAPVGWRSWLTEAYLLEAITRDALGDPAAATRAVERALEITESDGALLWFLIRPAPRLLARHARQDTAHADLLSQILGMLAGNKLVPPPAGPHPLLEPLSKTEIRVLRYLPTHLSAPEIASELSVSTSTVKTHLRNLYVKLGVHRRAEAVQSARTLGLLAPPARRG